MAIHKLDDVPNQPGHWYVLDIQKNEVEEIRKWLKKNLGKGTKMTGSLPTGWVPNDSTRKWTLMLHPTYKYSPLLYLVFWDKDAAALFSVFYPATDQGYPDPWL